MYKTVMCTGFPHRQQELDLYHLAIVNMASRHTGQGFYDYHCQFSARAATLLRYNNICIDWSVRDEILYNNIFSGRPSTVCAVCNSSSHETSFCTSTAPTARNEYNGRPERFQRSNSERTRTTDLHGRPRLYHQGKEVCNNFNADSGCRTQNCPRAHVCTSCKTDHSKATCPLDKAPPSAKQR